MTNHRSDEERQREKSHRRLPSAVAKQKEEEDDEDDLVEGFQQPLRDQLGRPACGIVHKQSRHLLVRLRQSGTHDPFQDGDDAQGDGHEAAAPETADGLCVGQRCARPGMHRERLRPPWPAPKRSGVLIDRGDPPAQHVPGALDRYLEVPNLARGRPCASICTNRLFGNLFLPAVLAS